MSPRRARVQLKAPFRWTAIIRSHSSSVISRSGTSPAMPASFTRMCTGPSAAWRRSTAAATLAALATSASMATARRWSAATSSATCRPPPWSRSSTATSAPSRARRRQIARPMPEAPPVTTAFRPLSPMPEPLVARASRRQTMLRSPMHLDYTPEQQALGGELRAYFVRLMTPEYQAELATTEGGGPLYMQTVRRLGADGWLGIGWPREYGGQGRTPIEQFIFFDEAARTDPDAPKHKGISMFIVPTSAPGYKITPIRTMGDVRTNATYYEDVRVPAEDLIGPENGGWWLITTQLNHERIALSAVGYLDRIFEDTCAWARATRLASGKRVIDRPWVQLHLARVRAGLEVLRLLNWQQAWSMTRGTLNYAEASAVKVYGSEFYVQAYQLLLEVMGEAGALKAGSPGAVLKGRVERMYRATLILTFGGGTNEVQRDIIAMAGLGMPRAR